MGPDSGTSNAQVFDELWSSVDLHYSFFELKKLNWDSLGTVYRQYALNAKDKGSLQSALATLLRELHDPHVALFEEYGPYPILPYKGRADTIRTFYNADFVNRRYLNSVQFSSAETVHAAMMTASIGYVRIDDFLGSGELSELDAALKTVASASSVIVDVRTNGGGNYQLAIDMAGRFVQRKATFGFLRFRNGAGHSSLTSFVPEVVEPGGVTSGNRAVYVLTNPATASSAEVFVLATRSNAKVTVVGDTTAGMSGGPTARELTNGWVYRISEWVEYTPGHTTYESIGLPPDSYVRTRDSDTSRNIDPVIERVLALIAASQ